MATNFYYNLDAEVLMARVAMNDMDVIIRKRTSIREATS